MVVTARRCYRLRRVGALRTMTMPTNLLASSTELFAAAGKCRSQAHGQTPANRRQAQLLRSRMLARLPPGCGRLTGVSTPSRQRGSTRIRRHARCSPRIHPRAIAPRSNKPAGARSTGPPGWTTGRHGPGRQDPGRRSRTNGICAMGLSRTLRQPMAPGCRPPRPLSAFLQFRDSSLEADVGAVAYRAIWGNGVARPSDITHPAISLSPRASSTPRCSPSEILA